MLRWIATGAAALGLIGGAGAVAYHDDGSATVKIKNDKTGQTQSVDLKGDESGPSYMCDSDPTEHLKQYDVELGRIKITMQGAQADPSRYNQLVDAFNALNDERSQVLEDECDAD
jgi:hypothetical protein